MLALHAFVATAPLFDGEFCALEVVAKRIIHKSDTIQTSTSATRVSMSKSPASPMRLNLIKKDSDNDILREQTLGNVAN
jgi:hypothetical protein